MSERIKEITKQAYEIALAKEVPTVQWNGQEEYHRIFAELLVKECAEVASEFDHDCSDDYNSGRHWAGSDILKHFGLK